MARDLFYLVSEDYNVIEKTRAYCQSQGLQLEVYNHQDWESKMSGKTVPSLSSGQAPVEHGATIIPFPGNNQNTVAEQQGGRVRTINELESMAIENAIYEFNGNLTEAAKALGIGRATLYRKVKQYNIDPGLARKKRAA